MAKYSIRLGNLVDCMVTHGIEDRANCREILKACGYNLNIVSDKHGIVWDKNLFTTPKTGEINCIAESAIGKELLRCANYAKDGYELSKSAYQSIHNALLQERAKIREADRNQNKLTRIANTAVLGRQKRSLGDFEEMDRSLKADLKRLRKRLKMFSIVVFGRTMAGKSTLMEILTHGDGASIGKGAQRTTLDVRDYYWQGMKITDVPGIASFDGEEDDRLAMEAAKAADLILFLITDDAPQQEEAARLAELRNLGKPVLGIVNVKQALRPEKLKLDIRAITKKVSDTDRLQAICSQFKDYANMYNQDWEEMPFVYTHLKAAYIGQDKENPNQELYELSNFSKVEEYILEKVKQDGCFLRIKNFIDAVTVPMQHRFEAILENSTINGQEGLKYRVKWHELDEWRDEFLKETQERYNNFMHILGNDIDTAINEFAEYNYDNSNAGNDWNKRVADMNLEGRCQNFLRDIASKCEKKRREFTDDLRTEIEFGSAKADAGHISMDDITDTQMMGNVAALGLGLVFGGPIGIVAGVLNWLLGESKSEKIRRAKRELREKITEAMDPVKGKISDYILGELNEKIFGIGIKGLHKTLVEMDEMLLGLAADECNSATNLSRELSSLNERLWQEAGEYITTQNGNGKMPSLAGIYRIPGKIYALGFGELPISLQMSKLLGDSIIYYNLIESSNHIVDDLMGTFNYEEIEYGEDGKISFIYFADQPDFELIKDKPEYKITAQIEKRPVIDW